MGEEGKGVYIEPCTWLVVKTWGGVGRINVSIGSST